MNMLNNIQIIYTLSKDFYLKFIINKIYCNNVNISNISLEVKKSEISVNSIELTNEFHRMGENHAA